MKILMIVFQFPPLGGMAVSRIYSFAKYWSEVGHDVTVLTPKKYPFFGSLNYIPPEKNLENLKVIEMDFAPWLTRRYRTKGTDEVLGPKSKKGGFWDNVRKSVRKLRRNLIGNSIDVHILWRKALYRKAEEIMEKERYDIVFSSFSPQATHQIASRLKRKFPHLLWVADYRDLWSGNHLLRAHPMIAYFQKRGERKTLKRADMLSTVSEGFAHYLSKLHTKEIRIVYNGYDHEEIEAIDSVPFFSPDRKIRIVHTGTIYRRTRNPAPLFKALKRVERQKRLQPGMLEVHFFGESADVKEIAQTYGVFEYVRIGGTITKEEAYRAQRDADLLLLLEHEPQNRNPSSEGTIPAKVYEYLASGTEIMAIGIGPDHFAGDLIERAGAGFAYGNDVEAIYRRIDRLISKKTLSLKRNTELIERFARKRQAKRLLKMMERMLDGN